MIFRLAATALTLCFSATAASAGVTERAPYLYRIEGPKPVAEYSLTEQISAEYLATAALNQPLQIGSRSFGGSRKALPPALALNLHFPETRRLRPFAGFGLSYSVAHEQTTQAAALELDRGFGTLLQAGAAIAQTGPASLRVSLSCARVVSDVWLNGRPAGTAEMDPLTLRLSYSRSF